MATDSLSTEPTTRQRSALAVVLGLLGGFTILLRLIPHPANFSPVGAMGLFGGAKLRGWQACTLSLAVLLVSDLTLWAYAGFDSKYLFHTSRIYCYGSFLIYVGIGRLLRGRESLLAAGGASLLGSLQFFLITNFCVWLLQPFESLENVPAAFIYSRDLGGLLTCFAAGLPFFQAPSPLDLHAIVVGDPGYGVFGLFVGDLFFTVGAFVLNAAIARKPAPVEAQATAETTRA